MPSLIGLLMLMGIVTKNSILLVDFAIGRSRRGTPRTDALSTPATSARGRSS